MSEKTTDDIETSCNSSSPDEEQNHSASETRNKSSSNEEMKSAEAEISIEQERTIHPRFSLESYPELPVVIFDENLEEQLNNYGKLGDAVEKRIIKEIEEGHKKLKDLKMSEESFKALHGEDFRLYQYATENYPCIVPGTQMTAFYLEFIRLFILLLARELKRRNTREKKDHNFSSASTAELIERTAEECEKISIKASSSSEAKSTDSTSSNSEDGKSEGVMETAKSTINSNSSEHSYLNSPMIVSAFSIDLCEENDAFISKLTLLKNMLDSDPTTKAFITKLELLIDNLKSVYYTGEETTEDSSTSADVSDLPLDPTPAPTIDANVVEASGSESENLSEETKESKDAQPSTPLTKVSTVPSQKSTDSTCDIDNLPEDTSNL